MKPSRILAAVLVVALLAAVAIGFIHRAATKTVSATFTQAVQLYPNDDVKVRGVKIGTIEAITPVPGGVRVDMTYDAGAPVSADAKAAIIAPTLLNRRYVQFAPSSHQGPQLPDGAVLGLDRTVVPVEYDEIKEQLNQLATTLGPANGQVNGSLTRLFGTTANNLRGNGQSINQTVTDLSKAIGTLSDGRTDLYSTIKNLNTVVGALRQADSDVSGFDTELATTSKVLADSSGDLHKTLDAIDGSFGDLKDFLKDNRDPLSDDVKRLSKVVDNLSDNRQAVADVLQRAPNLVTNFHNIYDGFTGSITGALGSTNATESAIGAALVGQFVGSLPVVIPGPATTLDEERNGTSNFIYARDGQCKKPDPSPHRTPPFNPAATPPVAPDGGTGLHPYFTRNTRCAGPGTGDGDLVSTFSASLSPLLVPPTAAPLNAPAPLSPLTAIFSGGH